jgi:hypothetical protein
MMVGIVFACGGGGDGGADGENPITPPDTSIQIEALDHKVVEPLGRLTISGSGFDPSANLTVSFFDDNEFILDVPVLEATSTSIEVAVPPYINPSTGMFDTGIVNVRVSQNPDSGKVTSNTITGLQIGALPSLTLPPGEVTANVAGFMELSLLDTIDRLAELDTISGGTVNTTDLRAQIEGIRLQYGELKTKIRSAMNNPDTAGTIGSINGVPISLDQENLAVADQLMVAMINGYLEQLQLTAPASVESKRILAHSNFFGIQMDTSSLCETYSVPCTASGQPLLTVKNTMTGEETAVAQYNYAMSLQGTSQVIGKAMKWFAAATATIGVVALTAEVTVPIIVVAAITEVTVAFMVSKYGLDAARLTANSNDKEAAKDLLDDFNGTLEYMRDSVFSPTISAMSAKAGVAYDFFTAWLPVVDVRIPDVLSQLDGFFDTPMPEAGVTGYWSGTINNPNLGIYGCGGGENYLSFSLSEDDFMNIAGSMGSTSFSGNRTGYIMTIDESTRFGYRGPYTWTWDGADTITGSVAYFCWSDDTGALLSEGVGTFTVTRY